MIQNEDQQPERAILAGVCTSELDSLTDTTDRSMAELAELAKTAGAVVIGSMVQNKNKIENGTYMGEGKLQELKEMAQNMEADLIIFDNELTPVQNRNISDALGVRVIDRTTLILDIFAKRAQSRAGKIQVELAQLRYMMPRLTIQGSSFSRMGAGIGTRGPGESKLETSRRYLKTRISHLRAELAEIDKNHELLRRRRIKNNIPVVALAGYTNAGKSSLLNYLTDAGVLAENKLFATLDPTVRLLTLPDNRSVLLSDTVGFINKLPHQLIDAFKSTLDEVLYADLILNIVDVADENYNDHITVVNRLLEDIGVSGKSIVCVLNKTDLVEDKSLIPKHIAEAVETIAISVKTGYHIDELVDIIGRYSLGAKQKFELEIPFEDGKILNDLHQNYTVENEEYTESGVLLTVWLDEIMYRRCASYVKN
jgi:GTP-binding protein HflX